VLASQSVAAELDDEAQREFGEESRRHREALSALRPGDSDRVAHEFNRHLDRVQGILAAFARRCAPALFLTSFCELAAALL
jgi:DNA-binding GntR family transcriptional regulator